MKALLLLAVGLSACTSPDYKCISPIAETTRQIAQASLDRRGDGAIVDCAGAVWRTRLKVES